METIAMRACETVPQPFVNRWMTKENGERSFEVTLLFEKNPKSWKVRFAKYGHYSEIRYGWKAFVINNGLQKGDTCVFKLLDEVEHIFEVIVVKHRFHDDSHTPARVTCTEGPKQKTKIEVIELD